MKILEFGNFTFYTISKYQIPWNEPNKRYQALYAESGGNIGRNYRDLNYWSETQCLSYESILQGCQVTAIWCNANQNLRV